MGFFENTTNYIKKIFNPQIRKQIDKEIAAETLEIAVRIKAEEPKIKFQEKVETFHKRSQNSWSKNIKSNSGWEVGWQKYKELDQGLNDKNKK
jgi:hypothetical protein